ncbi:MAG TPA: 50S ribosomal protein L11 methyltransferase [Solirubrobacteraceae bacterium]|nr:50S ribosomal protein L11 methyltransferase [Solirubrobacteraceae bacterium]
MIRLALRVRRLDAELVLADLLELAPSGVEEIELPSGDGGEGMVEYAVYGAPGELPLLPDVRAAAGGALVEISTSEVADDWSERWKQFHRPVLIEARAEPDSPPVHGARTDRDVLAMAESQDGGVPAMAEPHVLGGRGGEDGGRGGSVSAEHAPRARGGHCLFVRPPWEAPSDRADALEIVIDPAQAFGTGAHATTRMCLELLLELTADRGASDPVLDVGSGSGVLAIAALKLGYGNVLALDNDRESVRAILANAVVNDVELEARCFDLRRESLPWLVGDVDLKGVPELFGAAPKTDRGRPANGQVVLANLLRPLLIDLAEKMAEPGVPVPPEHLDLIASGLLREQADEVAEVFARRLGLSERARLEQGEWSALWLAR